MLLPFQMVTPSCGMKSFTVTTRAPMDIIAHLRTVHFVGMSAGECLEGGVEKEIQTLLAFSPSHTCVIAESKLIRLSLKVMMK